MNYIFHDEPLRQHLKGNFIDTLRLNVRGGHGGNGVPKYGGVGGQGGCVYVISKSDTTLSKVLQKYSKKRIQASCGEDSSKLRILGQRGLDEKIEVPNGVRVIDDTGRLLADLNEENTIFVVASGGVGGCSGTSYIGTPGVSKTIILDLKLIADIGLVGFPNAGKSTLLKAISNATPKIASYPFTTIRPQVGVVEYKDYRTISLADLPGLIEGAHANRGMGHKFLKHVERTHLLLMVVDIFGFRLSQNHTKRTALDNIYALNRELEMYDELLLDKKCILVINKMDTEKADDEYEKIKPILNNLESGLENCPEEIRPQKVLQFNDIVPVSAKHIPNTIINLKNCIRQTLDNVVPNNKNAYDKLTISIKNKLSERGPKIT